MKQNIKDYLHLYLGCEVYNQTYPMWGFTLEAVSVVVGDKRAKLELIIEDEEGPYPDVGWVIPDKLKLVLRPLSDMTGKELMEIFHLSYEDSGYKFNEPFDKVDNNDFGWRARNQNGMECFVPANSFKPEVFKWLLSNHFDLFNLIDGGLAIDKTKLNKETA